MRNERGSAMIVVLTLIILIAALIMANGYILTGLRTELKRIDRDQQKKFQRVTP
jgi:type II secretory pathway component PulK